MAFDIYDARGYGSSTTDATNPTDINSYAVVTAISNNTITLDDATNFTAGKEILIHVAAGTNKTSLGKWRVALIKSVSGNVLTLNKSVADFITDTFSNYQVQAVTVAAYHDLTISDTISPPAYSNGKGGIIVIKCSGTLDLSGGKIDLRDKGLTDSNARAFLEHETSAVLDTDTFSGYENSTAKYRLPLNVGDGAAFIIAKSIKTTSSTRIGNPSTKGVQFCRGASDSANCPSGVTNVGGSNLLICAESWTNFLPAVIAKYRSGSQGKGLCRCYIASNTELTNDEGLYSYDIISEPTRLKTNCGIKDFGNGSSANVTNPTSDVNVFARVTSFEGSNIINYTNKSKDFNFSSGALLMIHFKTKGTYTSNDGVFYFAKVASDDGFRITLRDKLPDSITAINLNYYFCQVIRVLQYDNLTINSDYNLTQAFDATKGTGGIFAVAVKDTCDLRGAVINMEGKGGGKSYGSDNKPMKFGNTHNHSRLPLGQGNGSVFILAKTLTLNSGSLIGASYAGNAFGGGVGSSITGGGYKGSELHPNNTMSFDGTAGSGAGGGHAIHLGEAVDSIRGGYGSNGFNSDNTTYSNDNHKGWQGAHVFIVADTIKNLYLSNIATGGAPETNTKYPELEGKPGGASYGAGGTMAYNMFNSYGAHGGAGGYIGGGIAHDSGRGGSGGFAFIYANNVVSQSTTDL